MEPPMDAVLVTRDLGFSYGRGAAVSGIDLTLRRGEILGFVGPNGAGKTTTIKLLLGLLTPSRGSIHVFGQPLASHRTAILRRVGALVETPALYGHLSADENLRIQQHGHGAARGRIVAVLERTGLLPHRHRPVRQFSLGMKQRLGIAIALLHEPELLVLDEPANGLDPEGIRELRAMLRTLAVRGMTILVSSHILAELEMVATTVAVIADGTLRYQGSLDGLKARSGARLRVQVNDPARALARLAGHGFEVTPDGNELMVSADGPESWATVAELLVTGDVRLYRMAADPPSLETAVMGLLSGERQEVGR
jgi:ABC-2 type transport system ATP-binding protein